MHWDRIERDTAKRCFGRALTALVPELGWQREALDRASRDAWGQEAHWRIIFPGGVRQAIWYISDISDASMALMLSSGPLPRMSDVIAERLSQNSLLKPFVRKVMLFDFLHPIQALRRMQRTALVMIACARGTSVRPSWISATALNLAYTLVVFIWLFDRSNGDYTTHKITKALMRLIGWT